MRNGIKKIFITSLFVIFGLCFNSNFAYEITNCYDGSLHTCYIVNEGEYITNGENTVGISNILNFESNDNTGYLVQGFKASKNVYSGYLFWSGTIPYIIGQSNKYTDINNVYEIKKLCGGTFTGLSYFINYCDGGDANDNFGFPNYTLNIDETINQINGAIPENYIFWTSSNNYQFGVCAWYGTGNFSFCVPAYDYRDERIQYWSGTYEKLGGVSYGERENVINTYKTESPFIPRPETTGSNVVCPSVQFKISLYGYKYNTGLCYTDPLEFTGGQIVQVEQQTIFEIFSGYQDYLNRKYIYENNCHAPYTVEHCNDAMLPNRKARQIFSKIENAGLDSEKVYQYCHLQLEIEDKTQGVCNMTDEELYATGVNKQESQPNPFESITNFIEENINLGVEAPREGTVFDEFLEDGETWITAITINRFGEFRKLYQKVMGLFKYRTTQVGIIPGYITGIIMMILLLALFKK